MSKIKEFLDVFMGTILTVVDRNKIRADLKEELSLNLDFLNQVGLEKIFQLKE